MILRRWPLSGMNIPFSLPAEEPPEYTWGRTVDTLDALYIKYYLQVLDKARLLKIRRIELYKKMDMDEHQRSFGYAIDRVKRDGD